MLKSIGDIQRVWRGARVRARYGKAFAGIRQRIAMANATATEAAKLGNRTRTALDVVMNSKSIASCLAAVKSLCVATANSIVCSDLVVGCGAIPILYHLMDSCNRSEPHKQLVRLSIQCLANLCNAPFYGGRFLSAVYVGPESVRVLADALVHVSDCGDTASAVVTIIQAFVASNKRQADIARSGTMKRLEFAHSTIERRSKKALGTATSINVQKSEGGRKDRKDLMAASIEIKKLIESVKTVQSIRQPQFC